jgi:hypothetical protein
MGWEEPVTQERCNFIYVIMITEHENIIIGVYWDDVGISG